MRDRICTRSVSNYAYGTELAGMTGAIFFIAPPALLERDRNTKIDASSVATYRSQGSCSSYTANLNDGKMYREHILSELLEHQRALWWTYRSCYSWV